MGSNRGFVVLDLETTGFSARGGDKIIEIGLVSTNDKLEVESSWSSLVNPHRDPGPIGIHGIRADWLNSAPSFVDIVDELSEMLQDRVLVMHNAPFDLGFLQQEFVEAQRGSNLGTIQPVCTLNLSRLHLSHLKRYKLNWLAFELNLDASPDHSALGDSKTTLELVKYLDREFAALANVNLSKRQFVGEFMASNSPSKAMVRPALLEQPKSQIAELLSKLPLSTGKMDGIHEFFDLLDEYLLDSEISSAEANQLLSVAREWGMGVEEVQKTLEEYFLLLIQDAWSDNRVSPGERNRLEKKASSLGLDLDKFNLESTLKIQVETLPFGLLQGDSIVLTGDTVPPKEVLTKLLQSKGLSVKSSVSRKTAIVFAADPNSMSGKAQTARELGIPVISAGEAFKAFSAI